MNIITAEINDINDAMSLLSDCTKYLNKQGILQWDEHYPNINIIKEDIINEDAYIIKDEGKIIAYVTINEDQYPLYNQINWTTDDNKVLVIHRLSVHPEYQGRGIARTMMQYIENYAKDYNYSCIRLDCYSENPIALSLYEKRGYNRVGEMKVPHRKEVFYCYERDVD